MLHSNLLLHGWLLSDVSFYTTELPQYMLIEAIRGLGPGVVNLAAAMTYTLLVLLAGLLAKGGAGGREGRARFLLAAGIVLAPQLSATSTLRLRRSAGPLLHEVAQGQEGSPGRAVRQRAD